MRIFNASVVEEFGFKAYKKGFFQKWQEMTSSMTQNQNISYDEAAERAYIELKTLGGSDQQR